MAANNLDNKLKPFAIETDNKLTDAVFGDSAERIQGFQPNTPISSKLTNTILRQTSMVTAALVQALKELSTTNLSTAKVIGVNTEYEDMVSVIKQTLLATKVNKAVLADNVVGGAEVNTAIEAKDFVEGFGISKGIKGRLNLKYTWVGTHNNNDLIYYSGGNQYRGWYMVHGLEDEKIVNNEYIPAQTLTITSINTPATITISNKLYRLTFEGSITTDATLTKGLNISSNSTDSQLSTAKAVYSYVSSQINLLTNDFILSINGKQNKISAGSTNDILTKTNVSGELSTVSKSTVLNASSTDSHIPTAKAVYSYVTSHIDSLSDYISDVSSTVEGLEDEVAGISSNVNTKMSNGTLIGIYTNNQTISKSAINSYKFLLFELKKLTTGFNGDFYGDSKVVTPDIFFYFYQPTGPKTWEGHVIGEPPFVRDDNNTSLTTPSQYADWLNANAPASGYNVGDMARNTHDTNSYVFAKVTQPNVGITQNGGIRLAQFDGNLTYATVVSISATLLRLNCDTSYNLKIWGFK